MIDPFRDLAAYVDLPRLTALALAPDGSRLVAVCQQPDAARARYVPSLWEIPLDGESAPTRLTHSEQGESSPAFLPDGTLLFTSTRPVPGDGSGDESRLWALPPSGEAYVRAARPGGLSSPVVARDTGAVVLLGHRLVASTDADDATRRETREDRKVTAVLHDGMPIRYWDHELGVESTRLLLLDDGADEPRDLAPQARFELENAGVSVSADGATVATTWRMRGPRGRRLDGAATVATDGPVDGATGSAAGGPVPVEPDGWDRDAVAISPDGTLLALVEGRPASFEIPVAGRVVVAAVAGGAHVEVELGDLFAAELAWSVDGTTLFVAGDLHGRGAVLAVDPRDGTVRRRLAADAVYSSLCPAPDGGLYALRSAMDDAPRPVRLDPALTDQQPRRLPTPAPTPPLPGTLTELTAAGDADVHTWLFTPPPGDGPAPVMLWVHGGPIASYNSWSWRWNPWVAVAHGWAVLLPDPALSTGYGQSCIDRAWPYRADVVWSELESVLDDALARPELDGSRVALLGGSFGGFMTNWIAGHSTRFGAIVTHAGLWALDQQHATTDAADYKTDVFGALAEHPDWYRRYSPHNTVDAIETPMLVVHGNRDYRVPVSEALRMWWDLVSRHDGDPADLPHRFLQFTGQNHWVLTPADAEIWYDVVLGFCARHVLGEAWEPSGLI